MCSLEVPDIEQAIADHYDENEVVVLLANAGNDEGTIAQFLRDAHTDLPSLMDRQESTYRSYARAESYAPFPIQVVIDQQGIIRYLAFQYDAAAVRTVIDSLLSD